MERAREIVHEQPQHRCQKQQRIIIMSNSVWEAAAPQSLRNSSTSGAAAPQEQQSIRRNSKIPLLSAKLFGRGTHNSTAWDGGQQL
jgi:hypothetical protein